MATATLAGREIEFDPKVLANPTLEQIEQMITQVGFGYDRYIGAFASLTDGKLTDDERMHALTGSVDGVRACKIAVWLVLQANGVKGDGGKRLTISEAQNGVGLLDFFSLLGASNDETPADPAPKAPKAGAPAAKAARGRRNASSATSGSA